MAARQTSRQQQLKELQTTDTEKPYAMLLNTIQA